VDYFLKLNGIKGGSNDAKHKDEIDVDGFGWGVAQTAAAAAGTGAGAGKAQFEDLSITTRTSVASPALFLACASGQHIKDAVFTARHAGGSEFLRIALTDVVVTGYEIDGTELEPPMDTITFSFARVEIEFRTMLPTGAPGPVTKAGWDMKSGKKL
jgi:type VI secretion system secreted protein Hcp